MAVQRRRLCERAEIGGDLARMAAGGGAGRAVSMDGTGAPSRLSADSGVAHRQLGAVRYLFGAMFVVVDDADGGLSGAAAAYAGYADPAGREEDASRPPLQGGDELAYLQPHQEGMPLHHIAWKSYAKTGQMLDKRFDMPQSAVRSMVISYKDYPSISHKERLAGLLCHRVLEAERSGLPYVLELPHRTIAPQKGQREMALTALALL